MITLYRDFVDEIETLIDDIRKNETRYTMASIGMVLTRDGRMLSLHEQVRDGTYTLHEGRETFEDGSEATVNAKTLMMRIGMVLQMPQFLAFNKRSSASVGRALRDLAHPTLEVLILYQQRHHQTLYHTHMHFIGFTEPNPHEFFELATNGSGVIVENHKTGEYNELASVRSHL
jgi:hypothetical protein